MIRTYKRKLILTKAQEHRLNSWINTCRFIYNMGLEIKIAAYRNRMENVHKYELMKQITAIRAEYDWIRDVPANTLYATIEQLDNSYQKFFKGSGFPRFARKYKFKSIIFKLPPKIKDNKICLEKLGWVKTFKDSDIKGIPNRSIIIKEPTGYFICIQCKDVPVLYVSENQAIGIDMGISSFAIDSNGNFIENPRHFKKYERRLRIENRSLARKKKGSNSWKRQAKKLSRLHHTIGNVRKDFLHKESTKIAKANSTVYLENLNIRGMVKNNLSKHILDAGWGMFKVMLEYKTSVVKINPKYTSQTCNDCGAKDAKSRVSQSKFVCTSCGVESNADINAAKNILSKGIALSRERSPLGQALALESINTGMSALKEDELNPKKAIQNI